MKWLRTFSIVEIFFQCLKKLVERRTRNPKVCFKYQVSFKAQFMATKILEKLKNHFCQVKRVLKRQNIFIHLAFKEVNWDSIVDLVFEMDFKI